MMKIYNILWFDDKYKELKQFQIDAEMEGITLIPFSSAEQGNIYLEENIDIIDGVLLDAIFFKSTSQVEGTEDLSALSDVWAKLNQLTYRKKLPRFIYSGQTRIETNSTFEQTYGAFYKKNSPSDRVKLFDEIKKQGDQLEDTQLRHQYQKVFDVCTEKYLGSDFSKKILLVIKSIEDESSLNNPADLLTPSRKIIETIFKKLSLVNLIPVSIIENRGWINGCSLFLSGRHNDFKHHKEFIHPTIAHEFHRLLDVLQDGSHGEGQLSLRIDEYMKNSRSIFLYKSTVFQLFEIIIWFKNIMDENPDKEANKDLWSPIQNTSFENTDNNYIAGKITRIAENGWATFKSDNGEITIGIPDKMFLHGSLTIGERIEIKTKPSSDLSKLHVDNFRKID